MSSTNSVARVSNPTKAELQAEAASAKPVTVIAAKSNDAAIALALLLDARDTIDALKTVLMRAAEGSEYFKGYHLIDSMHSNLSTMIGERVG